MQMHTVDKKLSFVKLYYVLDNCFMNSCFLWFWCSYGRNWM